MLAIDIGIFVLSAIVLSISGDFIIKRLLKLAHGLQIQLFLVSFILMAFATSLPELFVSITASIEKAPTLALGNVIGSNIVDLTLVAGLAIIVGRGIKVKTKFIINDALYMVCLSALPIALMLDGTLSRIDAVIVLVAVIVYFFNIIKKRVQFKKKMNNSNIARKKRSIFIIKNLTLFVVGMAFLLFSAKFLVDASLRISTELNLPKMFIGLFLVAIGTSLPELVFEVKSALKGYGELALGDAMGSVVVNSTLILGVAALINPIVAPFSLFIVSAIFMVFVAIIFTIFLMTGNGFSLTEGIVLLLFYVLFIVVENFTVFLNIVT